VKPPAKTEEAEPAAKDDPAVKTNNEAPPPQAASDKDAAPRTSDEAALKLLAAAAKRQGGASLAQPAGLESFFVDFGRILVWRWSKGEDGKWNGLPEEVSAMNISWMRHDEKPSSLRTYWELNGRKVTRAVSGRHDYYWLDAGKQTAHITPEAHPDDYAEVQSHRRLSETLIDVAVLATLEKDGSIWTTVDDAAYPGHALHREPAPGAGGLTFTIWLDKKTNDPRHVRVEPVAKDAPTMLYELTYNDELPKELFSVSGAKLRFPREVIVEEKHEGAPKHRVMHLYVKRVAFNAVDEKAAFAPPKR